MRFHTSPPARPRFTRMLSWMIFGVGLLAILLLKARDPQVWNWLRNRDRPAVVQRAERPRVELDESVPADGFRAPLVEGDELAAVRDDVLGLRGEEREAYLSLLEQAQNLPADTKGQSLSYAQLYNDLPRHRGELVTLEGEFRRVSRILDPLAPTELETTWEGWLFQREAGAQYPICVRFVELPRGMPTGEKMLERVRVTGYVFKRYNYASPAGVSTAPMLLAGTPTWRPRTAAPRGHEFLAVNVFAGITIVALVLGATVWRIAVRRQRREVPEPTAEDFAQLQAMHLPDLNETLREMERDQP